jgi:formate dehydrogenase maturation protein FdhE
MKPVTHMNYGASMGLHYTQCATCKSETLHKGPKCVHCAEVAKVKPMRSLLSWDEEIGQQSALRMAKHRRTHA